MCFCPKCGSRVKEDFKFCDNCGSSLLDNRDFVKKNNFDGNINTENTNNFIINESSMGSDIKNNNKKTGLSAITYILIGLFIFGVIVIFINDNYGSKTIKKESTLSNKANEESTDTSNNGHDVDLTDSDDNEIKEKVNTKSSVSKNKIINGGNEIDNTVENNDEMIDYTNLQTYYLGQDVYLRSYPNLNDKENIICKVYKGDLVYDLGEGPVYDRDDTGRDRYWIKVITSSREVGYVSSRAINMTDQKR